MKIFRKMNSKNFFVCLFSLCIYLSSNAQNSNVFLVDSIADIDRVLGKHTLLKPDKKDAVADSVTAVELGKVYLFSKVKNPELLEKVFDFKAHFNSKENYWLVTTSLNYQKMREASDSANQRAEKTGGGAALVFVDNFAYYIYIDKITGKLYNIFLPPESLLDKLN